MPAPQRQRGKWAPLFPPHGPLGCILHSLHTIGATMDDSFNNYREGEVPCNLLNVPLQHVKAITIQACTNARTIVAENTRKENATCGRLTERLLNKMPPDTPPHTAQRKTLSSTTYRGRHSTTNMHSAYSGPSKQGLRGHSTLSRT